MKLKIYQLQNEKAKYWFMDYDWAQTRGFTLNDYACVWEEDIVPDTKLDDIFARFNINRPQGFKGHSLSVSDLVELDGKKFYCDSFGWKEII